MRSNHGKSVMVLSLTAVTRTSDPLLLLEKWATLRLENMALRAQNAALQAQSVVLHERICELEAGSGRLPPTPRAPLHPILPRPSRARMHRRLAGSGADSQDSVGPAARCCRWRRWTTY